MAARKVARSGRLPNRDKRGFIEIDGCNRWRSSTHKGILAFGSLENKTGAFTQRAIEVKVETECISSQPAEGHTHPESNPIPSTDRLVKGSKIFA